MPEGSARPGASASLIVTDDNLGALLEQRPMLVLLFQAAWSEACKNFEPVFESVAARHHDLSFGRVDTDAEPGLARVFGVNKVPTVLIVRERILVARERRALPAAALDRLIEQARLIDMDDLRAELAALEGDADAIDH